jgi:ketoreductase RED1
MSTARRTVAVVGAGTIGLGWTTLLLSHGLRVRVNDPRPDVEQAVLDGLRQFAPTLPSGPADPAELAEGLEIEPDLGRAVAGVDAVQENGPEDLAFKQELFARIERAAPAGALLLSSTSGLIPDDIGARMTDPGRMLVGHPFNPPHIIPLVEVVPGSRTDPATTSAAVEFYRSLGKNPVVLRKPVPGFVANRLQSALLRESVHLVLEGVVSVDELDTVVTNSIGLRWAAVGPFLTFHLGGGPGGLRHMLAHLGPGMERAWRNLGEPHLDERTVQLLADGAERAFGGCSYAHLAAIRDAKQNAVLSALSTVPDDDCARRE